MMKFLKKFLLISLILPFCFLFSACNDKKEYLCHFKSQDVVSINVSQYGIPSYYEVTYRDDINFLVNSFKKVEVKKVKHSALFGEMKPPSKYDYFIQISTASKTIKFYLGLYDSAGMNHEPKKVQRMEDSSNPKYYHYGFINEDSLILIFGLFH